MSFSNTSIRKQYLQLLQEIIEKDIVKEFFAILDEYNLSVKLEHEICYQTISDDIDIYDLFSDHSLLCYFYNYSILSELELRKSLKKSEVILSPKDKAEKYFELSRKLIFFYKKGIFKELEDTIFYTQEIIEIRWAKGNLISDEMLLEMIDKGPCDLEKIVYNNLTFSIDGVTIFGLGGNKYYTKDDVEGYFKLASNKKYFLDSIRSNSDLINISELSWFNKLSEKSKHLIHSGNQYLNFAILTEDILDYAPLLLNFSKALENEIKIYYDRNFTQICQIADLVIANKDTIGKNGDLLKICHNISTYKENYSPSGYKPLPYILYYLGLGVGLERIVDNPGYLDENERINVKKEIPVIKRLFLTANNRNVYIHDIIIESKIEFVLYYTDIIQALSLLLSLR